LYHVILRGNVAPHPAPKQEDYLLLAIHYCSFSVFTVEEITGRWRRLHVPRMRWLGNVGKREGKRSLRRPRHRWMDINYILKKQDGMTDCIHFPQDWAK